MSPKSLAALAAMTGAAVLALAGPASAHVTIGPAATAKGAADVELTFRVPNEQAAADTTGVEVDFPTDHPITGVLPEPVPGWTATVRNYTLPTPVTTDDGTVRQTVQKITWTGGRLRPGQYQGFRVMLGKLPSDVDQLTFKAVQTYANGDIVRWIDTAQAGQPGPDHPAPVLALTTAGTPTASGTPAVGGVSATAQSPGPAAASGDMTARALGIGGIAIGALGLLAWTLRVTAALRTRPKRGS
ncbi:YcnI family protein [Streptomyces sp. NPDC005917]|uniref:YcnI family copper-binding membrane protein n=1 Tax=unclassified Streptomyces TaxID=2593676 RepID=UPI0033EC4A27